MKEQDLEKHHNEESVIRYFLLFLPPKGTKSILDIGAGRSTPYRGILKNRCENYKALDLRKSEKVDIVADITNMSEIKDNSFSWGWCVETLEHIPQELQKKAVSEILRVCENCVFTFPTPMHPSFPKDKGHIEVLFDFTGLENDYNVINKSTKNGRGIYIVKIK